MYTKTKVIFNLSLAFFAALLLIFPQSMLAKGKAGRGRPGARDSRATPGGYGTTIRSAAKGRRAAPGGYGTTIRSAGRRRSAGRQRPAGRRRGRSRYGYRGRSSFGIGFGFSDRYYYTDSRYWVSGHYETRTEQVLVEPAHYETQTQYVQVEPERIEIRQVPAVTRTLQDKDGKSHTVIVQPARTEKVVIPPKFEERQVEVLVPDRYEANEIRTWIPGYWVSSPSRLRFSIGGRFRF